MLDFHIPIMRPMPISPHPHIAFLLAVALACACFSRPAMAEEVRSAVARQSTSVQAGRAVTEIDVVTIVRHPQRLKLAGATAPANATIQSAQTTDETTCPATAAEGSNCRQSHRVRVTGDKPCAPSGELMVRFELACAAGARCTESGRRHDFPVRLAPDPACTAKNAGG